MQGIGGWRIRRFRSCSTPDGIPATPYHQTGKLNAAAAMRIFTWRQNLPKRGGNKSRICELNIPKRPLTAYLALRDQVLGTADAQLTRFIAGLDAWNRGNIDWNATCALHVNAANGHCSPIALSLEPHGSFLEPILLPSIRWWWRLASPSSTVSQDRPSAPPPPSKKGIGRIRRRQGGRRFQWEPARSWKSWLRTSAGTINGSGAS